MWSVQSVFLNFLLWILLVFNFISSVPQSIGDICSPPKYNRGICTLVIECQPAIRLIKDTGNHNYYRCGFEGFEEIVCCPDITHTKYDPTTESGLPRESKRRSEIECDKLEQHEVIASHIIHGQTADIGEFPHMVLIGYAVNDGDSKFRCGGSLISKNYVLTAAHCLKTLIGRPYLIRGGLVEIGNEDWNDDHDHLIEDFILHPQYTNRLRYNDIALIKLKNEVKFSGRFKPACIYTQDTFTSTNLTVTGWGLTNFTTRTKSNILLKVDLPLVAKEVCAKNVPNDRKLPQGIKDTQLCVGDVTGYKDSCEGDSGGPLQIWNEEDKKYRIVGIVSAGQGCATAGSAALYTKVSSYVDWIESVVWPN